MTKSGLLAVFAHPDDETFRCGGTLARLARLGVQVWVLCATRGEAGVAGLDPAHTGQIREAELQCACRTLGIEPPRVLDYQDGTLAQVDEAEAVARVTAVVLALLRPQVLLTWPPDGVFGHPDHVAVSHWTHQAYLRTADPDAYSAHTAQGLLSRPVAALYHMVVPHSLAQALGLSHLHTVPDEMVTLAVDVSEVWAAKMSAIRCHRRQMASTPILRAPEEKQRRFLGTEHFQLCASRSVSGHEPQENLMSLGRNKMWIPPSK